MKDIYESYIENAFIDEEQAVFKFKQFKNNYKMYFPEDKQASLLDIGVGRGEMLSCMKDWGYEKFLGVDISPSTIKFCQNLSLNCKLVDNTTSFLNQNTETFDLISMLDVLEHIPKDNTIELLKALKNALSKNGTLIIQVPNLQSPDAQLHMYNDFTHQFGYVEHSFAQVLIAAGFENFSFHGFEDIIEKSFKIWVRKLLRSIYWKKVRFERRISGNLNPMILNPIFFAIIKK